MDVKHFKFIERESLNRICKPRKGETKLGETIPIGSEFTQSTAKFVVIGIQESIGVKANLGIGGTHSAWQAFLASFLNIQDTHKLHGEKIHLLGTFDFAPIVKEAGSAEDFRQLVPLMDEAIAPLIEAIVAAHKIPVIIGGSHANAYPIIKGVSAAKKQAISVINLDAHADFRPLEGRHSGNPFSTAKKEGVLADYCILGLHENYNSQNMLSEMDQQKGIHYYFWEDIYLRKKITFEAALQDFLQLTTQNQCGIELDTDSIAGVLSSAKTPSGFSTNEARYYAYQCAHQLLPSYFHVCEAAAELETGQKDSGTGKLLSYLVSDFIKGIMEK
ncbi:arginase [Marivirga lumbricoides]|uniref:Arginase n=1 Tax=Marivirga lumbricoides TaxID=1046115 RepID=A0A2T4DE28_9BACT|nr:arginase [Marivirga lumbricoides]